MMNFHSSGEGKDWDPNSMGEEGGDNMSKGEEEERSDTVSQHLCDATLSAFPWTDGRDFDPDIHDFLQGRLRCD